MAFSATSIATKFTGDRLPGEDLMYTAGRGYSNTHSHTLSLILLLTSFHTHTHTLERNSTLTHLLEYTRTYTHSSSRAHTHSTSKAHTPTHSNALTHSLSHLVKQAHTPTHFTPMVRSHTFSRLGGPSIFSTLSILIQMVQNFISVSRSEKCFFLILFSLSFEPTE